MRPQGHHHHRTKGGLNGQQHRGVGKFNQGAGVAVHTGRAGGVQLRARRQPALPAERGVGGADLVPRRRRLGRPGRAHGFVSRQRVADRGRRTVGAAVVGHTRRRETVEGGDRRRRCGGVAALRQRLDREGRAVPATTGHPTRGGLLMSGEVEPLPEPVVPSTEAIAPSVERFLVPEQFATGPATAPGPQVGEKYTDGSKVVTVTAVGSKHALATDDPGATVEGAYPLINIAEGGTMYPVVPPSIVFTDTVLVEYFIQGAERGLWTNKTVASATGRGVLLQTNNRWIEIKINPNGTWAPK